MLKPVIHYDKEDNMLNDLMYPISEGDKALFALADANGFSSKLLRKKDFDEIVRMANWIAEEGYSMFCGPSGWIFTKGPVRELEEFTVTVRTSFTTEVSVSARTSIQANWKAKAAIKKKVKVPGEELSFDAIITERKKKVN